MKPVAAILLVAGLGGCLSPPEQRRAETGDLPPIEAGYRARIAEWSRSFYAEPASLRGAAISDPIIVRDESGRLLWLVCFEADAALRDGGRTGPVRQAFGFAPDYVSTPLARRGASLTRADCDGALTWRPFVENPAARSPSRRRG